MNFNIRILGLTASLLLAACGGGGGGGGGTPATAASQPVAITDTNAKAVAANALYAAQNTSSTQTTGLVTGVEVQAGGSTVQNDLPLIAKVARDLATWLPAGSGGSLATAVAFSETQACPVTGTLTVSGDIAGNTLAAGDTVSYSASNCKMLADGETLNGGMSITIVSGSLASPPYQVVMSVTVTRLSIQSGTSSVVVSGDMRLDLATSSTGTESLTVSGSSMTSSITGGTTTRVVTLKNYTQTVTVNGYVVSSSLAATVETSSTSLGAAGGSFTITTPTAVVWNSSTNAATAGLIRVAGAGNSLLLLTINSDGTVTLQVDADGNGIFEKTVSATVSELSALL